MAFSKSSNFPDYGATDSRFGGSSTRSQPKSNFDINTYHQLCDNISCNIFSINNNVTALEKTSKEVGTHTDTPLLRDKIHATQQSTKELVNSTTKFLKELNAIVAKASREHRLQSERVRNEFQATIQRYDTLQKQLGPKMKHAAMHQMQSTSRNIWNDDEEEEKQSLMDAERLQQQQNLQEELEFEQGLLLEREQRIREIESGMLDVNEILRDLAAMVHEQGDTIGSIEDNITSAAYNVEGGQQQLFKAASYQKAYRNKLCCLILVLVLVAIAITIIIYFSVRQ